MHLSCLKFALLTQRISHFIDFKVPIGRTLIADIIVRRMNERKLRSIYDVQTLLKELKMFASTRCLFCKPLDICHVALILFGACRLVPYRIPIDREEQR